MSVDYETGMELLRKLRAEFPEVAFLQTNDICLVGSTSVNGHGNDIDVAVRHNDLSDAAEALDESGWTLSSAEVYRGINSDGWFSAKRGEWNLLVSEDKQYEQWLAADRACKVLRAIVNRDLTRDERVLMHKAVFND